MIINSTELLVSCKQRYHYLIPDLSVFSSPAFANPGSPFMLDLFRARRIHNPKAVRAVASANATNPISILVPCHRVIGSNHKLTGYGGGLDAKKGLLELECSNTEGIELW